MQRTSYLVLLLFLSIEFIHSYSLTEKTRLLVISGPSAAGKTTIARLLLKEFPNSFGAKVSHTTRKPRINEVNGTDYYFVTEQDFLAVKSNGDLIESVVYGGNFYGTSKTTVENVTRLGKICVLILDINGAKQIKNSYLNSIHVFVYLPIDKLERRLRHRNSETEEGIQMRLQLATTEIEYGTTSGNYDFMIENDNLKDSYEKFRSFLIQEMQSRFGLNLSESFNHKELTDEDFVLT